MPEIKHIFVAFVLITLAACHQAAPRISVEGSRITIDSGSHRLEGTLEPESTYQFLLKDEGVSVNTFAGDALVTVLPLETAEHLRGRYGDFFRCNRPGAVPAQQKTEQTILIAGSKETRRAVLEAMKLVRKSRIPVVRFQGSLIRVTGHTYLNLNVTDSTGTRLYFLNDFDTVKSDFFS
jgi:hypothetical protein